MHDRLIGEEEVLRWNPNKIDTLNCIADSRFLLIWPLLNYSIIAVLSTKDDQLLERS